MAAACALDDGEAHGVRIRDGSRREAFDPATGGEVVLGAGEMKRDARACDDAIERRLRNAIQAPLSTNSS
jgi:hypothetical protein